MFILQHFAALDASRDKFIYRVIIFLFVWVLRFDIGEWTGFSKKVCVVGGWVGGWVGGLGPLRFGSSDCSGPDGDNGMSFCQLLG